MGDRWISIAFVAAVAALAGCGGGAAADLAASADGRQPAAAPVPTVPPAAPPPGPVPPVPTSASAWPTPLAAPDAPRTREARRSRTVRRQAAAATVLARSRAPVARAAGAGTPGLVIPPPGGWRSLAKGHPWEGRLVRGVLLPASGPGFATYDPILQTMPNREWRRWGTDRLVATIMRVLADFHAAHPEQPPVLVGDLSRPRGGVFDARFGGLGHNSHQNGLDVDIAYPRRDRSAREPRRPAQVDRRLAQELVDRFVAAGAQLVFVGPRLKLRGPPSIVQPLVHHDDHLHVRLPAR